MSKRARILVGLAAAVIAVWGATALWRANTAIESAERQVAAENSIAISNQEIQLAETGVEQIGAPSQFTTAAVFKDRLYAAGPGGLFAEGQEFQVGERLPPAPITSMAIGQTSQASEPQLWLGTSGEGMLAFDGSRFRHLRPRDAKHRKVTSVLPLSVGRVLFGTEKAGVLAFDGQTLASFHDSLKDVHVTALAGDETDLWIGTTTSLLHWRGGKATRIEGLPDPHVLTIGVAEDGKVYAGTALGIAVVRNDALERVLGQGALAKTILVKDTRLYAAGIEPGIYDIPLDGGRPHFRETADTVHKMIEVNGRILAASEERVFDLADGSNVLRAAAATLTDRNISALSVDSLGRLWVGYFDRGLDILEADFSTARHLEDQHLFCVNRIVHGSKTAVATANGLVLFDGAGQKRQVLGREQGLIANHFTDVVFNGSEMIAATPAGLSFIAEDGVRSLYAFHGLVNNHAYALGLVNNRLIAGTLGGLSILEAGAVQVSYTTSNSPLRQNWITAIAAMGKDAFVGTYGAGVAQLTDDGGWQTFSDMPVATEINPGAMIVSGDRVYAGTLGKGLLMYSRADHRWHTITRGLPSMNVTALHASNGRVFVGTDNGLVRLP